MNNDDEKARQFILDVVRGHRGWNELEEIGITIQFSEEGIVIENRSGKVAVAEPEDVAEGLLRYADEEHMLQQWGTILLGASSFVQLNLESLGYGEALLEGLWDASSGDPIRQGALAAARELRTGSTPAS